MLPDGWCCRYWKKRRHLLDHSFLFRAGSRAGLISGRDVRCSWMVMLGSGNFVAYMRLAFWPNARPPLPPLPGTLPFMLAGRINVELMKGFLSSFAEVFAVRFLETCVKPSRSVKTVCCETVGGGGGRVDRTL